MHEQLEKRIQTNLQTTLRQVQEERNSVIEEFFVTIEN